MSLLDSKKSGLGSRDYANDMSENNDGKLSFFTQAIIDLQRVSKDSTLKILDVGACDGDLIDRLVKSFGTEVDAIGVDLSKELSNLSRGKVMVGNGYDLESFGDSSFHAVLYSSFLHELGSYHESEKYLKYTRESYVEGIKIGLEAARKKLLVGGRVFIKDPVQPIKPLDMLGLEVKDKSTLTLSKGECGFDFSSNIDLEDIPENFLNYLEVIDSPLSLPYLLRMLLFLRLFRWSGGESASGELGFKNGKITLSRGLVSEISRHMPWSDTRDRFIDEAKEWYGSLNIDEWEKVLKYSGFKLVSHQVIYQNSDHASDLMEVFLIYNNKGEEINPVYSFPTHHFTILEKI